MINENFNVEIKDQYIHVILKDGGQIQIKLDVEGVIVDLYDEEDECFDTMAADYNDFSESN